MAVTTIDMSEFTKEELFALIDDAKRMLYPEATVVEEELICAKCKQAGTPALIEEGMTVTHNLVRLSPNRIEARGWDGRSSGVSEEGERLLLECPCCFQRHSIPESLALDWL
ncbi:MAG TPA: hypothetical protein VK335_22450 [Bryobacteraceae bacterium]|nr:hypothetical protein [Bryobacteraceae bacterium]